MDQLPPETLCNIVAHCDLPTQKILRLVCKDLSDFASEHVFDTVFLALVTGSVDKVRRIANHPRYSRHVRTLVFCPELLPRYRDLCEWKRHNNSRTYPKFPLRHGGANFIDPSRFLHELEASDLSDWKTWVFEDYDGDEISVEQWIELPERVLTRQEANEGFRRHVKWFRDQQAWLKSGFTCDMRELLHKFTNLENAEVPDYNFPRSQSLWRSLSRELFQTPGEWARQSGASVEQWGVEQLASLLEAFAMERKPLKKLKFGIDPNPFLSKKNTAPSVTSTYGQTDDRIARMNGVFAHVRELHADFWRYREEVDETVALRFASLLRDAKQLEKLTLELTQSICHCGIKAGVDFLEYVKPMHFPKLTSLTLTSMRTSEENLLGILSAHAKTLQHLSLKLVNLAHKEGTWHSIIYKLRSIVSLKSVHLSSLGEIAKPHGLSFHVQTLYHLFDCDGPGWEEYYFDVVCWILHGGDLNDDDFPILSAHEWDEIFPENPALSVEGFDDLDSDDDGSDVSL